MTRRNKKQYAPNGSARQALIRGLKRSGMSPESEELRLAARQRMVDAMARLGNDPRTAAPQYRLEPIEFAMEYFEREERHLVETLRAVRVGMKDIIEMARETDVELARRPKP